MTRIPKYPEPRPQVAASILGFLLRLVCLALAVACLAPDSICAQTGSSVLETLRRLREDQTTNSPLPMTAPVIPATPLETPIDPSTYLLVPGDQLYFGVWGELTRGEVLTVSPEGDLILSDVGPIPVRGLTLAQAEERLAERLRTYYTKGKVSLRLLQPGRFRIFVAGMVSRPGVYEVSRVDRLSAALEAAGGIRPGGSARRIVLRQADATPREQPDRPGGAPSTSEVDLLPWTLRGDQGSNPLLEPGLTIEIPAQGPTVRVRGPVNGRSALELSAAAAVRIGDRPEEEPDRLLEWRDGDTLGDLLNQVGGISERATGRGVLYRQDEKPIALDLTSAKDRTLALRPGDLLEVGYAARWVFVVGSVRSPGRYPFLPDLTVGDYVSMAGGPTELGRPSGWTVELVGKPRTVAERSDPTLPGSTIRVPERRTYRVTTILAPLSSAAALILSLFALTR